MSSKYRIPGTARLYSPEVYFQFSKEGTWYPLHPEGYSHHTKIEIPEWPDQEKWHQIFIFFQVDDPFVFATFAAGLGVEKTLLEKMVAGFGLVPKKFDEIVEIASFDNDLRELYLQNIPYPLLRQLGGLSAADRRPIADLLLDKKINKNSAREILSLWLDLSRDSRERFQKEVTVLASRLHKDSPQEFSPQVYNLIYRLRFPEYSARLDQLSEITRGLPEGVELEYDKLLESPKLKLCFSVRDKGQFEKRFAPEAINKIGKIVSNLWDIL